MSISPEHNDPRAQDVQFSDDEFTVILSDGRRISVPVAWFPRLLHATSEQRSKWQIIGDGQGVHWPDIDEDISVEGLLRGAPSAELRR